MKIVFKSVFGVIPVPVFFTDWGMEENVGGCAKGPLVWIKPKYLERKDEGIIQHELTHVKQFYTPFLIGLVLAAISLYIFGNVNLAIIIAFIGYGFHAFAYLMIPAYRLWSEVTAYRIQSRYYPDPQEKLKQFANFISWNYRLKITPEAVLKQLVKKA